MRTTTTSKTRARAHAAKASATPWVLRLARMGYLAKGGVYAVIGLIALQAAFGSGGRATDQKGAIQTIAAQPFGTALVALLIVGLVGFVVWRVVQVAMDPDHKGRGAKGLASRAGYAISAAIYASLAVFAVRLLMSRGGASSSGGSPQDFTARLLDQPMGALAVGLLGLGIAAFGAHQCVMAYRGDFKKKLNLSALDAEKADWAARMSAFGLAARGVVFIIIGSFFVQAAVRADSSRARGLDGALQTLAEQPFGALLLALVALGLVAYAGYQALEARYRRLGVG